MIDLASTYAPPAPSRQEAYDCGGVFYDGGRHPVTAPPFPAATRTDADVSAWKASVSAFYSEAYTSSGAKLSAGKAALCTEWFEERQEPAAARPDGPQVARITEDAMQKVLDAYEKAHPIEGDKAEQSMSVEEDGTVNSGMISWFSQGAEIYRAEFNSEGKLIKAFQTPEGRSLDIMKKFEFAYYSGDHGIAAASLGRTADGLTYISHISYTNSTGRYRGFMDFDQTGSLTKGVVYKANGDTLARWNTPP